MPESRPPHDDRAAAAAPVRVEPNPRRVVVRYNGRAVADTRRAVTLFERGHRPVHYLPREDADMEALRPSTSASHCPLKGEAGYFTIKVGDRTAHDAVWTYADPLPAVAAIAGRLAFYPDRVDAIEELEG